MLTLFSCQQAAAGLDIGMVTVGTLTFDQDGDVFQWTEYLLNGTSRALPGNSWFPYAIAPLSSIHFTLNALSPTLYSHTLGFRVASLPVYDVVPGDINADGRLNAADIKAMEDALVALSPNTNWREDSMIFNFSPSLI